MSQVRWLKNASQEEESRNTDVHARVRLISKWTAGIYK